MALILSNALLVLGLMMALWLWSLIKRDASVVDPWWSMGFLLITLNSLQAATPGRTLLAALVAIWALRLWAHLLWRNWGKPEDARYRAFREKHGQRWWWLSFFHVFLLQGTLMLIISAPLQIAMVKPGADVVGLNDLGGALLVLFGLIWEAIADAQLAAFKRQPDSRGKVMQSGVWRYSRHPNYFGEAVLWWGFWLSAADAPGGLATIFAPILMTFMLLKVSGVAMLEPGLHKSKPGYAEYKAKTSAFVPWPPRST